MTVDKRRIDACLKACKGISTQNLEDNVPFLELARRYNVVLRERDAAELMSLALRAKITEMEQQKPAGKFIQHPSNGLWEQDGYGDNPDARPLYALPGAKGEEK